MTILITGAAGNLGSLLSAHLIKKKYSLRLMVHNRELPAEIAQADRVTVVRADLADPFTLSGACSGTDTIVHFAGVLFRSRPEKFLPVTNTLYFRNLLEAALEAKVKRVILISFPHVEGETTPERPASGRLDCTPVSVHAATRLEEEKLLFEMTKNTGTAPVSLRAGMVYGRGVLMIEAARWLSRHRLLAVWKKPTGIHLISTDDFLSCVESAAVKKNIRGIYHLGDEGRVTLQEFLDRAAALWGRRRPWRMPAGMILAAAWLCERFTSLWGLPSPLTRDFVRIGMVSYYGDTARMRRELLPRLKYPTLDDGIETLR